MGGRLGHSEEARASPNCDQIDLSALTEDEGREKTGLVCSKKQKTSSFHRESRPTRVLKINLVGLKSG